jgi:hypothetical protein
MSYPDEDEARVEAMIADLAAADAIPESIKMMNDAALRHIARNGLPRPLLAEAMMRGWIAGDGSPIIFTP